MLINGFPRSGTTYLFDYLRWYENNYGGKRKVLLEPIFDLVRSAWVTHRGAREKVLGKEHYSLIGITLKYKWPHNLYIYDERDVKFFLERLRGYPMKTVNLHLYLDLAKEDWEVYHIIRHPASVYLSVRSFFFSKASKLLHLYDALRFLPVPDIHPYYLSAKLFLISEKGIRVKVRSFLEAFTVVWTFTNKYAIKSVGKNLLIYNKEETLYKLPKFDEYVKRRRFKPKTYGNEAEILRKMREVATKYNFKNEFDELISLFG